MILRRRETPVANNLGGSLAPFHPVVSQTTTVGIICCKTLRGKKHSRVAYIIHAGLLIFPYKLTERDWRNPGASLTVFYVMRLHKTLSYLSAAIQKQYSFSSLPLSAFIRRLWILLLLLLLVVVLMMGGKRGWSTFVSSWFLTRFSIIHLASRDCPRANYLM